MHAAINVPTITQRTRIPQSAIDDMVNRIIDRFHPQRIILFGSYTSGMGRTGRVININQVEPLSWKNFHRASASVVERTFLVGLNASGKSNFLDALRFLSDLAAPGGKLANTNNQ